MAPLLTASKISKGFTDKPLFLDFSLALEPRERIGMIGPNGAGKSTLLKVLAGILDSDSGTCQLPSTTKAIYVAQEENFPEDKTLFEIASEHAREDYLAEQALSRFGFTNFNEFAKHLSGGWRKRLSLARAFAGEPDLLFLDEPTNHLDLEGIRYLESILQETSASWIMITHDRALLDKASERIIEVSDIFQTGTLITSGNYSKHLESKELFLISEQQRAQGIASVLRKEEEWLRRQPKARGTKAKARIDTALEMRENLGEIQKRLKTTTAKIDFSETGRKTKRLVELSKVAFQYGEVPFIRGLDLVITPGVSIGLLGSNGSGKSTILKLINDDLKPSSGKIERVHGVRIVYFDQYRSDLNDDDTLKDALQPDGDSVIFRGGSIHIHSWAKRFRFPAEKLLTPVKELSGGERARLLIAKLMLEPADILLLDEPTNDLDIETIEVLEESLLSFEGALLVVSHDRRFLEKLVQKYLGLLEGGEVVTVSSLQQFEQEKTRRKKQELPDRERTKKTRPKAETKKLSYNEKRELEGMEEAILSAEAELEMLQEKAQSPELQSNSSKLQECYEKIAATSATIEKLYERWEELSQRE